MCKNLIRLIILTLVTCMITGCLFGCILGKEEVSETDPSVSSDTVTEGTETSSIETDESEATESEIEEAEATEEGSTESETEIAVFELTAKNLANYVIVVNESKSSKLSDAVSTLQGYIKKVTGESPSAKPDFIAEGSDYYCESEFEILVGHTARAEDTTAYEDLRNKDTGYAMIGKKLVIIGETETTVKESVRLFFKDILYNAQKKDVLLRSGESKVVNGDYEIEELYISGTSISEYSIVYPSKQSLNEKRIATALGALLTERTGYKMEAKSDSAEPSDHEIWIGNVNRVTSEMKASVSDKLTNTNCVFCTENGNMWVTSKTINGLSSGAYWVYETLNDGGEMELCPLDVKEIKSTSLSVMSYNVRGMLDGRNTDELIESVRSRNPDIFAAQEAVGSSASNCAQWMQKFDQTLTDTYACVKGIYVGNYDSYLPIFYKKDKFELVESGSKYHTHTPDVKSRLEGAEYDRQFTYAILRDKETGVEFLYVNIHLDTAGYKVRTEEAKILASFLEPYSMLPTVVGGDFNTALDTSPITTLLSLTDLAAGSAVADSENVVMNPSTVKSYTSLAGKTIDHVFVSKELITVQKYEVWDNVTENGNYPSDHIPVYAEITVTF